MMVELADSSLFSETDFDVLDDISAFSIRRECSDGEILIEENSSQNFDIFILSEGRVEITSNSTNDASSEVVISSREKDLLGEISWLLRTQRTATVRCFGEAIVIQIDGDKLMDYFESHNENGYHFMKRIAMLLSKRLVNTDDLLKQLLWNI